MKKLFLMYFLLIGTVAAGYSLSNAQQLPDPVKKAKGLQKELKLTDAQTDKIATIYQESSQKFEKIRVAKHGNSDKMLPEISTLRVATVKKIKGVLTPVQALKYDKLVSASDKNSSSSGGWSDGWSSVPAAN